MNNLSKNIKFLRQKIDLSINEIADLLDIDPISFYQYEKEDYKLLNGFNHKEDFIAIGNYFCIRLDHLVYANLEEDNLLSEDHFEQLKNELAGVSSFDRGYFSESLLNDTGGNVVAHTDPKEEAMSGLLIEIHRTKEIESRYNDLRTKGLIDGNGFFQNE